MVSGVASATLRPGGRYIYGANGGDVTQIDTQAGTLDPLYTAQRGVCPIFWFDEPGDNVVTCSGSVYSMGASELTDFRLRGVLPGAAFGVYGVNSIAHSSQLGMYAASLTERSSNQELTFYGARNLRLAGKLPFTPLTAPESGSIPDVFFNADGSRVYGVIQSEGASYNLPNRIVVETLPIAGATAPCPVTLGPAPAALPSTGGVSGVSVTTASNCLWRMTATDSWIQVLDEVGIGNGAAGFAVPANYSTIARTGKVFINGVEFAVAQGAGTPSTLPLPGTVEPSSGAIRLQTFVVRLPNAAALTTAYISFGSAPASAGTCTIEYTKVTAAFRLLDDSAVSWSNQNLAGSLNNSQCWVDFLTSHVSGSTVLLTFTVHFSALIYGQRDVYVIAFDPTGSGGWRKRGSYIIGATSSTSEIGVIAMVPESGTGTAQRFTGIFTHSGGVGQQYLGYMLFLRTPNIVSYTAKSSCLVEYNRISHGMRLVNDAGDDWLGPLVGVRVGTPGAKLTNAQCSIDIASAKTAVNNLIMTVEAPITFHSASPVTMTFLQSFDVMGRYTGMTQMGTWVTGLPTNPAPGPAIQSVIKTSSANTQKVSITATHTGGASQLGSIHLRFGSTIVAQEFCHVYSVPGANAINLISDAGIPAGPDLVIGGAGTLSNSRCSISAGTVTKTTSGNSVNITVPVTFHNPAAFEGDRNVYVNAFDVFGNLTHWVSAGSVRIQ